MANLFNWTPKTAEQMQLKIMAGFAALVLLLGIASVSLMHNADAAYGTTKDKPKTPAKDKAKPPVKTPAKAPVKTPAKPAGSVTTSSAVNVSIPKGAASSTQPGCDAKNACYVPADAKVSVGGKVTWKNDDNAAHTVTSGTAPTPDGKFDSSLVSPGKTFSFTFKESGTINYFCSVHPWMKGTVTVS